MGYTKVLPAQNPGYYYLLFVEGVFMADNQAVAIYGEDPAGNTKTCGKVATFTTTNQQYAWNQFQFEGPVFPGTSAYLYFVVYNQSGSPTGNPTGLRVEFISPYFLPVK